MIKAIIFDMGGVLVGINYRRCVETFKEKAGFMDIEDILDPYHQRGFLKKLEEGACTEEEFYREALTHCRPGTTADTVRDCLASLLEPIEQYKADYLNELKDRYSLYMLSNNNPIVMKLVGEDFRNCGIPLETTFQDLFISSDMKLLKPFAPIYQEAIRRTGLHPEEILFIDDSISNVEGAAAQGINAVHYDTVSDLRIFLEDSIRNAGN